jgi:hypothetical protein
MCKKKACDYDEERNAIDNELIDSSHLGKLRDGLADFMRLELRLELSEVYVKLWRGESKLK